MEYEFKFEVTAPLEVEEAFQDRAILSGTFLKLKKVTKNGREYQIEEGDQITKSLMGMPVFFGTDPLTNKHIKSAQNQVGRVFKTLFDKGQKIIKGFVEIWNTALFPDLVSKVKKGWGFSIGGIAKSLIPTGKLNKLGRAIMKVLGMKPNHLQLLEPQVIRGQVEAQVKTVKELEETFEFDPCPWGLCTLPEEHPIEETEGATQEEGKVVEEDPPKKVIHEHKIIRTLIYVEDPDTEIIIETP